MSPSQICLPNHRITGDAESKRVARGFEADALDVHRNTTLGLLLAMLSQTGRDGTEQRDVHDVAAEFGQRGSDAQRAGFARFRFDEPLAFKRLQVASRRPMAAKVETAGDFPQSRGGPSGLDFSLDEIQHPLLG